MSLALALTALGLATCAVADQVDLVSPDTVEGREWRLMQGARQPEVVPDPERPGETLIRLPYDMGANDERAAWDIDLPAGMVGLGRFEAEMLVDKPNLARGISIYFQSDPGWLGAWMGSTPRSGETWRHLRWNRSDMSAEGSAPWGKIRAIRISIWKQADGSGALLLRRVTGFSGGVAVVRPAWAMEQASDETERLSQWSEGTVDLLESVGVTVAEIEATALGAEALAGVRVAILPYDPELAPGAEESLAAYVGAGGKLVVFYCAPATVLSLVGVEATEYLRNEAGTSEDFESIRFEPDAIAGMPESIRQDSWNVYAPRALREDAKTLGWWESNDGQLGEPAFILSDTGAFVGHVLTSRDRARKAAFLRALVGHFAPEIWPESYATERLAAVAVGPYADEATLSASVRASEVPQALRALERGLATLNEADAAARTEHWVRASQTLAEARERLMEAYALSLPSRPNEFRAVWCHSAFGVADWGWERSIETLADSGFTAIFPNMLWAGLAYYPSEYLPVYGEIGERGDQIAQCLEAAHARGIEVHVWKVNHMLGDAPEGFVERLRAEGRLQLDAEGNEVTSPGRWLCPSQQANFELERDSMLEVVRNYDVDGIHFDYIRYPSIEGCYCDRCRRAFEERLGHPVENWPADVLDRESQTHVEWLEFRRANINRLVEAVAEGARAIRPDVKVSAAVFGHWPSARDSIGQDWVQWIENGWLDFVCPMDYIPDHRDFEALVEVQEGWVAGRVPMYPGIGAHSLKPDGVAAQVEIAREHAPGFIVFNYNQELAEECLPLLRLGATSR